MRRLLCLFAIVITYPGAAHAQGCKPRAEVVSFLVEKYGESRKAVAMSQSGNVLEIWANEETGTWSATHAHPSGLMCIVDSGQGYQVRNDFQPTAGVPT